MSLRRICQILIAGIRLKCPRCGRGPVFFGFFKMHAECPRCRLRFEREQGFFVGAIYLNYGATVVIAVPGFFILDYLTAITLFQQLLLWCAFALLFPLFFFRYSRSLWLSLVYMFIPEETPSHWLLKK